MDEYQVGTCNGMKDVYGHPAVAIIYDGDSVLCVFPGSNGKLAAQAVCNILNAAHNLHNGGV